MMEVMDKLRAIMHIECMMLFGCMRLFMCNKNKLMMAVDVVMHQSSESEFGLLVAKQD